MAYFLCPYPKFYCLCSFLVQCSGRKSSQLAMSVCFSELTDIGVVMRSSLLPLDRDAMKYIKVQVGFDHTSQNNTRKVC